MSPGFDTRPVASVSFDLGLLGYSRERSLQVEGELLDRVTALPGVSSATLASVVPLSGTMVGTAIYPEAADPQEGQQGASMVALTNVWPRFFETLGISLSHGRDFTPGDRDGSERVVVVNETLAQSVWPGADAIGRRFRLDAPDGPWLTVVGVAKDAKYDEMSDPPRPFVYLPYAQGVAFRTEVSLLVRAREGDAAALLPLVGEQVRALDADLPLFRLATMTQYVRERSDKREGMASLLALFGALAMGLASVGLYGTIARAVAARRRETGIRLALGARAGDISGLFVREGLRVTALGLLAGSLLSLALTRLLQGFLFGVSATDAATFAAVALLQLGAAAAASWLPAHRAARRDPIEALRCE
jgi:predicted permease